MARAFGYLSGGYAKHLEDDMLKVPRFFLCVFVNYQGTAEQPEKPINE